MANQTLGLGSAANDGTGDTLRAALDKVNDNFLEIYTLIGDTSDLTTGISATASVVTLSSAVGTFTTLTPAASDGTALGSASLEFSDLFLADAAVINLGADQDTTLTHVADTGILLNSTRQLQFGDSGTYIHQSADGVLDLVADTEIEINATTIDINGAVVASGEIAAVSLDISGDVDVDGTLEADAITIDGVTLSETISDTVGAMVGSNTETGISVTYEDGDNTLDFVLGSSQTTISSLTNASLVVGRDADNDIDFATDNNIIFRAAGTDQIKLVDGALAPVTDAGVDLGTSTLEFKDAFFDGTVTSDAFAGPLTGEVTGNAATATTLATARTIGGTSFDGSANIAVALSATATALANARTIGGTSFDGTGNIAVALASVGTAVTVADESSDTTCFPLFTTAATGDLPPKSGTNLTFNSSSGLLTATGFAGALTGNVTGNASGTAATVTGAAQTNITSLGTLTALTVDNLGVNGNTITANSGALNLTPASGSAIVLDGTINVDAGVVTGGTSITSTAFVGNLTGNVTGNASGTALTVTQAAQTNITSVGTLTALQIDNLNLNGNTLSSTAGTDLLITPLAGQQIVLDGTIVIDAGVVTGATSITSTAFVGNVTGNLAGTVTTATQNSITTATGLVSVGALDSGSITSGFTSIDVGAGTITTTGAITGGSVAGRKTIVSTFNTTSAVTASLTAAQSGATILIDGTEDNVINLPAAATTNPGIFYDLIVRVAVAGDKTTIVNIAGSGGGFVGALSLAGGTAANAVLDNAGDALTFVNSTVVGSRAKITCIVDDGTDGTWQVECLASPIATIA